MLLIPSVEVLVALLNSCSETYAVILKPPRWQVLVGRVLATLAWLVSDAILTDAAVAHCDTVLSCVGQGMSSFSNGGFAYQVGTCSVVCYMCICVNSYLVHPNEIFIFLLWVVLMFSAYDVNPGSLSIYVIFTCCFFSSLQKATTVFGVGVLFPRTHSVFSVAKIFKYHPGICVMKKL